VFKASSQVTIAVTVVQEERVTECPLLAQSGHHDRAEPCPLLGVKRTYSRLSHFLHRAKVVLRSGLRHSIGNDRSRLAKVAQAHVSQNDSAIA
jgi:hypothetical protein